MKLNLDGNNILAIYWTNQEHPDQDSFLDEPAVTYEEFKVIEAAELAMLKSGFKPVWDAVNKQVIQGDPL